MKLSKICFEDTEESEMSLWKEFEKGSWKK